MTVTARPTAAASGTRSGTSGISSGASSCATTPGARSVSGTPPRTCKPVASDNRPTAQTAWPHSPRPLRVVSGALECCRRIGGWVSAPLSDVSRGPAVPSRARHPRRASRADHLRAPSGFVILNWAWREQGETGVLSKGSRGRAIPRAGARAPSASRHRSRAARPVERPGPR